MCCYGKSWVSLHGDGFASTRYGSWAVILGLSTLTGPTSWHGRTQFFQVLGPEGHPFLWGDTELEKARAELHGHFLQVLSSLLNQSENLSGWPRVVSEDIAKQVHKLKNEMFVMGGKIKGKTLLPIPEHLGSLDGTLESMERWVAPPGNWPGGEGAGL